MSKIKEILKNVTIPRMYCVQREFQSKSCKNVEQSCVNQVLSLQRLNSIPLDSRIAVCVGSRGINQISKIVKGVVYALQSRGMKPIVIPAMGSHGGATAEGQKQILKELGVTEQSVGCPVQATMEVVELAKLDNGLPVYMDSIAAKSDGIVVINRIKPHTAFRGRYESGLVKMLAIGLGNHIGAASCHRLGFGMMKENIVAMAKIKLEQCPVLFGVGVIEDAYDQVSVVGVIDAEKILDREPEMLALAKRNMPFIGFDPIDVLVVDRMGKEISGDGMDTNITGRYTTPYASGGPTVSKLVVLSVTEKSHGNVIGIGAADICTQQLYDVIDFEATYINGLTATVCAAARIPMVFPTDEDAIRAAIITSNSPDLRSVRFVRIRDTLHLTELMISESLLGEARKQEDVVAIEGPFDLTFNEVGAIKEM